MTWHKSAPDKGEAMSKNKKTVPNEWAKVLDAESIARCVSRITYEILERDRQLDSLVIVGIRTNGEFLARRIHEKIKAIEKREVGFGVIDITLYRDDLFHVASQPVVRGTDLPQVAGARVVLVDDVLFTGRTVRAALDAIVDFGRPARVELAVIADRGHREYPIRPDYVGKNLPTKFEQFVRLMLSERGYEDALYLIEPVGGES